MKLKKLKKQAGPVAIFCLLSVCISSVVYSLDKKLALTPPMGWNSWNTFRMDINEDLIKGIADSFVELGLKEAGYEYIVIDDGWQFARDSSGTIIPDSTNACNQLRGTCCAD